MSSEKYNANSIFRLASSLCIPRNRPPINTAIVIIENYTFPRRKTPRIIGGDNGCVPRLLAVPRPSLYDNRVPLIALLLLLDDVILRSYSFLRLSPCQATRHPANTLHLHYPIARSRFYSAFREGTFTSLWHNVVHSRDSRRDFIPADDYCRNFNILLQRPLTLPRKRLFSLHRRLLVLLVF